MCPRPSQGAKVSPASAAFAQARPGLHYQVFFRNPCVTYGQTGTYIRTLDFGETTSWASMCCEPTSFPWGYSRSPRGEFACLCGITSQFQSLCFHLPILGCFYQSHSRKLYFFQLISFLATLHCQQSICMALCHTGYRKAHLFYKHVVFCLPLFLAAPGRALSNMEPVSVRVGTHAN